MATEHLLGWAAGVETSRRDVSGAPAKNERPE